MGVPRVALPISENIEEIRDCSVPLLKRFVLTYMATVQDAIRVGVLEDFRLPDWELRPAQRPLAVAPELWEWADETPEMFDKKRSEGGRLLIEHLEQGLQDMCCAAHPSGADLHRVDPQGEGIWKLTVPGVRVFGWFHARSQFVAVAGELKSRLKANPSLHGVKQQEVRAFAQRHGLEQTILLGDHRDVL